MSLPQLVDLKIPKRLPIHNVFDRYSLYFNRADLQDQVDLGTPAGLNFGVGDFSCWVWCKTSTFGVNLELLSRSAAGVYSGYVLRRDDSNCVYFAVGNGVAVCGASSAVVVDGLWHLAGGMRDAGTRVYAVLDGVSTAGAADTTVNIDSLKRLYLGRRDVPGGELWYDGYLANVGMVNRLLTADEWRRLFWEGYASLIQDSVLNLPLDEGGGLNVYDRSGLGNNGVITGAEWRENRLYEILNEARL